MWNMFKVGGSFCQNMSRVVLFLSCLKGLIWVRLLIPFCIRVESLLTWFLCIYVVIADKKKSETGMTLLNTTNLF